MLTILSGTNHCRLVFVNILKVLYPYNSLVNNYCCVLIIIITLCYLHVTITKIIAVRTLSEMNAPYTNINS